MSHRSICKLIPALALACAVLANAGESEPAADTTAHAAAGAKNSATSPAADTAKTDSAKADSVPETITQEHIFNIVGLVLPHNSLRNSKTLHNWPFFAVAVPGWVSTIRFRKDLNKVLALKGFATYDLGFNGIGLRLDASIELIHLLELGVQANTGTALNYGETATFMGVYEPERRDYRQDIFFTEFAYGIRYHAALTIPLLAFLPKSKWTKIIIKGTADYTYSGYTGAEDGEVWKAGSENLVNGFKYKCGGTLIYILPFKRVNMAMLAFSVSGFKHAYDFDDAYRDYNPGFKTVNITPMASIKINDNWNGMLMAIVSRDRVFENRRYPTTEELLQKQVGSEWDLRSVMFIASRKF